MAKTMTRSQFNALKGTQQAPAKATKTMTRQQFNSISKTKSSPVKTMSRSQFEAISQKKPTGFKGFAQNLGTDFSSFSKGVIGLGKEFIRHPIYNTKQVGNVLGETARQLPDAVRNLPENIKFAKELARGDFKGIQSNVEKHYLPQDSKESKANKIINRAGLGIFESYANLAKNPLETAYNRPFSTALDILPATKALGVNKLLGKGAGVLKKTKMGAKVADTASDIFVPQGKLKRLGYGDVAEDVTKTGGRLRKAQEGIIRSTVKKFDKDFKLDKAEKLDFFESIDKLRRKTGVPTSANPKVQKAIDWWMKTELPKLQKISGLGDNAPIENYLHHFFNPTKETNFGGKLSQPQRGFLKRSKDVEGFSKDPITSIAGVKTKAATANIKESFVNRTFKKYGKNADEITEFEGGKIVNKVTGEEMTKYKGKYFPKELGDELLKFEGKQGNVVDKILTPLRVFNRNWKPLATAVRPRYHLRNIIGNVYNASFVGGANPLRYPQAVFQQMKGNIAQNMKDGTISGKIYKAIFKEAPEHKYIKMATQDDVIGRGFFSADINDISELADTVEDMTKAIAKLDSPAEIYKIPILRQWMQASTRVGSAFEDNARLALYIDRLKKGASRIDAKEYVNKHLFDYLTGLGKGDQYIKAVIPFWSWTRFNVPLQAEALVKNPLRHLAVQEGGKPFVQQNEDENSEYRYLSNRDKASGALKVGETIKDGKVFDKYARTQSVLPFQDLARVPNLAMLKSDELGFSPVFDIIKNLGSKVSPPDVAERNLDYWGRPVEQYPGQQKRYLGQPVSGTTKEILGTIPLLSEINKLFGGSYSDDKRPDFITRLESVINPVSISLQDREKNREYFTQDFERKVKGKYSSGYETAFKGIIKKIMESPEPDKVLNKNKEILTTLLKQAGYTDKKINEAVLKAIESQLKEEKPKPKRPSSLRPKRPSPLLDPYYEKEVKQRAGRLNPYFKN